MASAQNQELIDRFEEFYRSYYRDEIGELAQLYPNERRSLIIDWGDLYRFDQDMADDLRKQPGQLLQYAEEALRRYDLPADISLGQAHLRVANLPDITAIREIRSHHVNSLVEVRGIIRKATDVRPKIQESAFECQRCGTLTRIPQTSGTFQEPHECQGCERQGPFRINFDQSEFIDAQKLRVQESPEGLRGGETPQSIDIHIEDDITGRVNPGDHVRVTGILHLEQQGTEREKSTMFDVFMEGVSIEVEDEQFDEMDITDQDKQAIIELSNQSEIYDQMVKSIAPTIYGHEEAKLAMILQLFSGVTKHLPDGSRTRGDLHMLLIGDPGTGKCVTGDTMVTVNDDSTQPIREIVEEQLIDPIDVDDGIFQNVNFTIPSLRHDGSVGEQRVRRVWKREAPDTLIQITTKGGKQIEVTPTHPLFIQSYGYCRAIPASALDIGQFIAVERGDGYNRIPNIEPLIYDVRTALELDPADCGLKKSDYVAIESGDRSPTRAELLTITEYFVEQIPDYNFGSLIASSGPSTTTSESGERPVEAPLVLDGSSTQIGSQSATIHSVGASENIDAWLTAALYRLFTLAVGEFGWDKIVSMTYKTPESPWVYDLEIDETHNFFTNGVVSHNSQLLQYIRHIAPRSVYTSGKGSSAAGLTASAVRDDFGDGQQWSLEAGALVLADKGIAAVDELDKMRSEDRSAMHQALEQQEISISKAGINATLKSRCSLLGAANPKYGRFDQYEPIGEQIELEPALISRFDLIFTMSDQPDPEEDRRLAQHILKTNYAGELSTQLSRLSAPDISQEEIDSVSQQVEPAIEPDLLRKYIAYAQQTCYPRMSEGAMQAIQDFYVDLRSKGTDEDAPVPVTARKLEALVRLSEASARVRLSDHVTEHDAERVIEIVRSCLQDIGVDPETGQYDVDVVETGRSKTQRDRMKGLKGIIRELQDEYEEGAPIEEVLSQAEAAGIERSKAEHEIQKLRDKGEIYSPNRDHFRVV